MFMENLEDIATTFEELTENFTSDNNMTNQRLNYPLVTRSEDIRFYSLSVIIPLGLVFNSLSACVLLSPTLKKRSANMCLAALAISDDVSLITLLFDY